MQIMGFEEIIQALRAHGVSEDAICIAHGLYALNWRDEYILQLILQGAQGDGGLMQSALFHAAFTGLARPLRLLKKLAMRPEICQRENEERESWDILVALNWIDAAGVMGEDARGFVVSLTDRHTTRELKAL